MSGLELRSRLVMRACGDLVVDRDHVYVADITGSLGIVDVADPDAPRACGSLAFDGMLSGLAGSGSTLFVAERRELDVANNPPRKGAVHVIDIGDPAAPARKGAVEVPGGDPDGLARLATCLLVPCVGSGLAIIDISKPADPKLAGLALEGAHVTAIHVAGPTAYVAHHDFDIRRHGRRAFRAHQVLSAGTLDGHGFEVRHRVPTKLEVVKLCATERALLLFDRDDNLLVLDRADPARELYRGPAGIPPPTALAAAGDRAVCFHPHGACAAWGPGPGPARTFIEHYVDPDGRMFDGYVPGHRLGRAGDVSSCVRRDRLLFAAQRKQLSVYDLHAGSIFAAIA